MRRRKNKKSHVRNKYMQEPRPQRAKKILNLEERVQAIQLYDQIPVYVRVADEFKCSWEQIKNVVQNRDSIMAYYARCQTVDTSDDEGMVRQKKINFLGKVMFEYVKRAHYHKIGVVTDESIRKRALLFRSDLRIASFYPNKAWVNDFKLAYKLDLQQLDSIVTTAPPESLQNKDIIAHCLKELEQLVTANSSRASGDFAAGSRLRQSDVSSRGIPSSRGESIDLTTVPDLEAEKDAHDNIMPIMNKEGADKESFFKDVSSDDDAGDGIDEGDAMDQGNHGAFGNNGDNVIDLNDSDDEINENEEGPTIYYGDMDEAASVDSLVNLERSGAQSGREHYSAQQSQPSKTVASTVNTSKIESSEAAVKETEAIETSQAKPATVKLPSHGRIEDYKAALDVLRPLEEFALVQEDFRAVNLLSQLVTVYRSGLKRKHSSSSS